MKNLNNLDKSLKAIKTLRNFFNKYPDFIDVGFVYGYEGGTACYALDDAILAGKVLGKEGWTRERDRYNPTITYDWKREVDGVKVKITAAETQTDLNETPVPPKAFPLQLEESVS